MLKNWENWTLTLNALIHPSTDLHKRDQDVNEHDEDDDDGDDDDTDDDVDNDADDDDDNTRIGEVITGKSAEDAGCVWYWPIGPSIMLIPDNDHDDDDYDDHDANADDDEYDD